MFEILNEAELLEFMRGAQRRERVAVAERLLAAGRLCQCRIRAGGNEDRTQWCVDNWEAVAAEVGAELGISRGRASSQMSHGLDLLERFPKLASVFAAGEVEYRIIVVALFRTGLITDGRVLAAIDSRLARAAPGWNRLSRDKIGALVDWFLCELDPDAVRLARRVDEDRHVYVDPACDGISSIWGAVRAPDAVMLDRRLDQLAGSVCDQDPRTAAQRRADALGALAAGAATLACDCGSSDCPVRDGTQASGGQIVIHLLAEAATVTGQSDAPALLPGAGTITAETVRALSGRAKLRPLISGTTLGAEPRYRPSAALAEFIRCRDLTCRFPGCDRPAEVADIDHTVPYPVGPTHPSNLKLLCRVHHLLKTFYGGPGGWCDRQLPDGTVLWTAPSGQVYATTPGGALFFPQLAAPTGELSLPSAIGPVANPARMLMMPARKRTRAEDKAARISSERRLNAARAAADPPPF